MNESEDEDYLDLYDVEPEDLLFDLDEGETETIFFDLEEDVYSDEPKKIKNKKYVQDYFGMDVGRVVGDDDAADYILEDDMEDAPDEFEFGKIHVPSKKSMKRNPFKYNA